MCEFREILLLHDIYHVPHVAVVVVAVDHHRRFALERKRNTKCLLQIFYSMQDENFIWLPKEDYSKIVSNIL